MSAEPNRFSPPDTSSHAVAPPPMLPAANPKPSAARKLLLFLLSLCLGLFLADAAVSLLDDTTALGFKVHALLLIRLIVGLPAVLLAVLVYVLMAFIPAIPKSLFVPLALSYVALQLAALPLTLLYSDKLPLIAWASSAAQLVVGLWLLHRARRGWKFGWPLLSPERLGDRRFSWSNLIGFALANVLLLLPAICLYLFLCTAGLVSHFTEGFMTLHPDGFRVQARQYVRADGKTIQLFPMSHVAEGDFYREISQTFPTNSLILMEGVTDENQLLKHKISYKKMAGALGLTEQHEQFEPTRGEIVPADIDVSQFTTNTLDLLNLVILIHNGGLNAATLPKMMQFSSAPGLQEHLVDDLLRKRNKNLLEQIQKHLAETGHIVVPWGVAHMPEVAREIQKSGFRLANTDEYVVIRFLGKKTPEPARLKPDPKR